jgi:hypothetical protein
MPTVATLALPLFAQAEAVAPRGYAISWAVVLLGVILGLVVALRPAKREDKVQKPRG